MASSAFFFSIDLYRLWVQFLKGAILVGAALMTAALLILPFERMLINAYRFSALADYWVPEAWMTMPIENPRISEEVNGYLFEMQALRAKPLSEDFDRVRVLQVEAFVSDPEGLDLVIKAGMADWDNESKIALLRENVRFSDRDENFLLQTSEAYIDVGRETLTGVQPVLISTGDTKILGQSGFKILEQGKRVLVLGETQMVVSEGN